MGSLPERPPVVLPEDPEEGEEGALAGAHIELQIDAAQNGLWTVVQWQDSAGDWQTVEGWRGALETGGRKVWWVSPAHFNTGPYRWEQRGPPGTAAHRRTSPSPTRRC
ncbi:MAG: hypothetical protein ACE5FD_17175, partial [Anaerolineae bacterium]